MKKSTKIRLWVYGSLLGIPLLVVVGFIVWMIASIEYQARADLRFVRQYDAGGKTIEERVHSIPGIVQVEWVPGELGATCLLHYSDRNDPIPLFFVRRDSTVYASSRRTADLIPQIEKTDLSDSFAYDTFGGAIPQRRPNKAL